MDQLKLDFQLKALYPTIQPGDSGVINDVRYTYKGSDVVYDQIEQLKKTNPELLDVEVCSRMLADPIGYRAPRFVLDPGVSAALSGQTNKAFSGALGVAMGAAIARGDLDVAFATGAVGGLTKNAALGAAAGAALEGGVAGAIAGGVIGNALKGPLGPVLGGALGGAIGGELGKIASGFVPPGLDGPIDQYVTFDPDLLRPAEVDLLVGDSSKARKILGWKPKVEFENLVQLMVENDLQIESKK